MCLRARRSCRCLSSYPFCNAAAADALLARLSLFTTETVRIKSALFLRRSNTLTSTLKTTLRLKLLFQKVIFGCFSNPFRTSRERQLTKPSRETRNLIFCNPDQLSEQIIWGFVLFFYFEPYLQYPI